MGNLFSIQHALKHVGADAVTTSDPLLIAHAERLILPGVGAFEQAMQELQKRDVVSAISEFVHTGRPLLGICLGMQLLFTESFEFGHHKGLDLISGKVIRFKRDKAITPSFKIPQIGWNRIEMPSQPGVRSGFEEIWHSTILKGITEQDFFYFVHSYVCVPDDPASIVAESLYGIDRFCSVTNKGNVWGCQFHPEKSGENGLLIYKNFVQKL
jgi:glutamine amidotransferase